MIRELKLQIELSDKSLEAVSQVIQDFFQKANPSDEQNKSIIADTAYWYLGVKPAFTLGELYFSLGVNKSLLKTSA